jgi:hypothetical protein
MQHKKTLILVTRHLHPGNRRALDVLSLQGPSLTVRVVCETNTMPADNVRRVPKLPNPVGLVKFFSRRLKKRIDAAVYFPSAAVLWALPASIAAWLEVRRARRMGESPVLVTIAPPHDLALVGLTLKHQVSWIAVWLDLFSHDAYYWRTVSARKRRRVARFETRAMDAADLNVVTTDRAAALASEGVRGGRARFRVRPHSFPDNELVLDKAPKPHPGHHIEIVHMGGMFKLPKVPGAAAIDLLREVRRAGVDVRLTLVGDPDAGDGRLNAERSWITVTPMLAHEQALRIVRSADWALVVLAAGPGHEAILHYKTPHYLAAGTPILALVPTASAAADAIRETGAGVVVPLERPDAVERVIEALTTGGRAGSNVVSRRLDIVKRYSWSERSTEWRSLVEELTSPESETAPRV